MKVYETPQTEIVMRKDRVNADRKSGVTFIAETAEEAEELYAFMKKYLKEEE